MGKRVMQVLDHCTIYFLIAGTYTPIALRALKPMYPVIGWGLFAFQWAMTALAVTLTAIDLKKYNVFSMICYIGMGWAVIFFLPQTLQVLGEAGFGWQLGGGIAYTFGSILYGIGSKKPWFHSVFHIFVLLGSLLQLICIVFYVF
jgi:hemolysin III